VSHQARRLTVLTLAALVLGGCGSSKPVAAPASPSVTALVPSPSTLASPTPAPLRSGVGCDEIQGALLVVLAEADVASKATVGSKKWSDATDLLLKAFQQITEQEVKIQSDIQFSGRSAGGDDCLAKIAGAEDVVGLVIGGPNASTAAAGAYELLLTYYPDSPVAFKAKNYLQDHGYLLPTPAPT